MYAKTAMLLTALLVSACHDGAAEAVKSNYMLPVCETAGSTNTITWQVSDDAFDTSGKKTECTLLLADGLPIGNRLRITAYRNGLADLEFTCNEEQSKRFMLRNAGRRVALVMNNQVAGEAVIAPQPTDFRCGLLFLDSLETAVNYCEKMSSSLKFDKAMCTQICSSSDTELSACVAAKDQWGQSH